MALWMVLVNFSIVSIFQFVDMWIFDSDSIDLAQPSPCPSHTLPHLTCPSFNAARTTPDVTGIIVPGSDAARARAGKGARDLRRAQGRSTTSAMSKIFRIVIHAGILDGSEHVGLLPLSLCAKCLRERIIGFGIRRKCTT